MGWFDEQIRQRKKNDEELFQESFADMADAVLGTRRAARFANEDRKAQGAIDEILRFFHIKPREVPENLKGFEEITEFQLRPHGIMRRNIVLEKGWYKDSMGPVLGVRKDDGSVAALLPRGFTGYVFFDAKAGKWVRLNKKNEDLFEKDAVCFYKPLPLEKLGMGSLLRYIINILSAADYAAVIIASLVVSLVGMLTPRLNNLLFSTVVESQSLRLLASIAVFMISAGVSGLMFTAVRQLLLDRITTKLDISVQAATMMRVLSLPADFFHNYSAGDLSSRTSYINSLCSMLVSAVLNTGLTSIFSIVYIGQIFAYAPALVAPALLLLLATTLFSVLTTLWQMKIVKRRMELNAKESGMSYALISGIQKIKLAGAEKRAFARWSKLYAKVIQLQYNPPMFLRINTAIHMAITLAGTIAMYSMAVRSNVSVADYYAFNSAYGMVSAAFAALVGVTATLAQIKPAMEMAAPILNTVPEISEGKQVLQRLSGGIELSRISFRYDEKMPLVIDDLSLKVRPGQYLAIVGSTGCGKSTLIRLILGFETPQKGAVYFDGKDLSTIDQKSLRRKIGVVMQNGKLFPGDIFSNIVISAPWLTLDDAWEAAEMAGIADDIRRMPMGMHTMVSEGSGGISGGQRQRLLIARAIAPRPKILIFDEATSALDNITQKIVSDSLDKLNCTRIVIAHRLSTIRHCDRIVVLDKGKIIEDGTYESLIEENGFFAELVARQRLDA